MPIVSFSETTNSSLSMGKLQPDRFSGGLQLTVNQVWDLPAARCRFGKYLRVAVNGAAPDISRLVKEFPARREMTRTG
jgi:DNA polymerase-3 subunit alpha